MDLAAYFRRIGYTEGGSDTERLYRLHRGHITHIPFENIDVYNDLDLSLKPEDLFDKMVTRRRGGYCFEMNGLFYAVLKELGFSVYGVVAHLSRGEAWGGILHRVNVCDVDGARYVCDVGYGGDCFVDPIKLEFGSVQETHGARYRVREDDSMDYVVQIERDGKFCDMLGFYDIPAMDENFSICSFYTNHSPMSVFRKMLMLSLFTETGRYTMSNQFLTVREGDSVNRREVPWEEMPNILKHYFGLDAAPDHQPAPLRF